MKSKPNMTAQDWDEYYAQELDVPARRLLYRNQVLSAATGSPATILDVGCGTGDGLAEAQTRFPSALLWGVDYSWEAIRACRNRFPVGGLFHQVDITKEPMPYKADLVMCVQTLEHFQPHQIGWILSGLFRATQRQLIISVPRGSRIPDQDHKTCFDERSFATLSPDVVSVQDFHLTFGWTRRE